jgi:hypothetical protein
LFTSIPKNFGVAFIHFQLWASIFKAAKVRDDNWNGKKKQDI